jgi:hypothetical protein
MGSEGRCLKRCLKNLADYKETRKKGKSSRQHCYRIIRKKCVYFNRKSEEPLKILKPTATLT